MDSATSSKGLPRAAAALAILYLLWMAYAITVQQPLSVDGCHFFLKLLEERWFVYGDDVARHHAHYLTQALTVLLARGFGVRDLGVLSWAFCSGLFLPQVVGLAASYLAVRKTDFRFLIFPVLTLLVASANESFNLVHESQATTSLFWPLFFCVLLGKEYHLANTVGVLILALLFIRTYETVAVLGAVLLVLLGMRMRGEWKGASGLTRALWVALTVILLAGVAVAVRSVLVPRVPGNRADFFASLPRLLEHWPFLLSAGYLAAITLFAMVAPIGRLEWPYRIALIVLVPLTLFVGLVPAVAPELTRPGIHHAARGAIVLVPAFLAVPAFLVVRGLVSVPHATWGRLWRLVAMLAVGQLAFQVLATAQWNGFRTVFSQELRRHRGPTPFATTVLAKEREGMQLIRPMTWAWTQPTLSIVWAPDQMVQTLILNPPIEAAHWQPFDPVRVEELPHLE